MSLFGSLMGDFNDPIFGSHMRSLRQMDNMINSMFSDPFGMMGQNAITDGSHHRPRGHQDSLQPMLFPGFPAMPNMNRLFTDFSTMAPSGDAHSYCTTSVMTMSSGPDGRPQVYQETRSTTAAPGGIKQTQNTVCDSRTGTKKMAIGHHIGERAHIMEREQNMYSGEQEERQEFINLDEEEADEFNHEWQSRSRRSMGAIGSRGNYGSHSRSRPDHKQLALPDPSAVNSSRYSSASRWAPTSRRSIRPSVTSSKTYNPIASSSSKSSGSAKKSANATKSTAPSSSATVTGNRKREHSAESKVQKKRHAVLDSDL